MSIFFYFFTIHNLSDFNAKNHAVSHYDANIGWIFT